MTTQKYSKQTKQSNKQTRKQIDKQTSRHKYWGRKWGLSRLQDPTNQFKPLPQVLSVTVYDAIPLQIIS